MYPKVFIDYALTAQRYGPVSLLPTPVFFYGMLPQDEVVVEIERGKALVIQLQALSDVDDDGLVKVFFELNGQPRMIRVLDRSVAPRVAPRRKADDGDANHVAAPMPGIVTAILVAPGSSVRRGEALIAIEAMKMETVLTAPRDAVIDEVLVRPRDQIDAKDLILTLSQGSR
jgi:pyruvate carboxylase